MQRFQELLHDLVTRQTIHHAVLAVSSGDGRLQWSGASGEARPDGTPMQPDTPYFIASVDKLFTATIVFKLCERGHVGLNEPISTYLPRTLIEGTHRLDGVDYTDTITVRHLLGHTSGLADWLEDRPKGDRSMLERVTEEGDRSLPIEDLLDIVRRLTPHFRPQPCEAMNPKVRYSDTNFMLLAALIEAVTARPLHQVHEEMLFRPLNLRHTWVAGHSSPLEPALEPATVWAGKEPLEIPRLMQSIWGIFSTAEDGSRFLRALVRGDLFDDRATLAKMQERWNRFGFPLDRAALRLPSWPIEYGLGIMRFHDPVLRLVGHLPRAIAPIYPAPAVIGHTGSTGSWSFHCPRLNLFLSGTVDQAAAGAVPFRLVPKVLRIAEEATETS